MNIKKYFLFSILFMFFTACNGTKEPKREPVKETNNTIEENNVSIAPSIDPLSDKQKFEKALDYYLKQLSSFNTDEIVELTYPKLFKVIDLELFRQYIASMMNSTDIKMTSYESNITKISAITTFTNDEKFTQVDYITTVTIQFLNNKLYNTEEKINFLYDALIHKYGQKNIYINVKKRILRITKQEKLIAIKEKETDWKFLGDNSKYRQLYPNFLPIEILRILK